MLRTRGENKGREYKENYAGKPKDDRKPQDKYYRRSRNGKRGEQNKGKQEPRKEETEKDDPEPGDELRERENPQEQGGHNDEDPYERAQHEEPPETHEESGGNKDKKNQRPLRRTGRK